MGRHSVMRTRWAAVGAAVAVTLGAGGIGITHAVTDSGERPVYLPIEPCRLAFTTTGEFQVGPRTAPLGPGEIETFDGWGSVGNCTLPTGTAGLALNVTALGATTLTNLRFYPADTTEVPTAANLNPSPGQPPTPNAVNVDLDGSGQFNVFNAFGNVTIVIDVVGLYDDHHHDDRYYTKAQTDSQIQGAIDAQPWSFHIAPSDLEATDTNPAMLAPAGPITVAGLGYLGGVFGRAWYGLQLPDAYSAGTDIRVDMLWVPRSLSTFPCDSVWRAGVYVSRADAPGFQVDTTWEIPRGPLDTATRLTATQDQYDDSVTSQTYMTIDGSDLAPGDMLTIGLVRDGAAADDTCDSMLITGLTAHEAP